MKGGCTFCRKQGEIEQHHVIPKHYNKSVGCIACCHDCHKIADKLSEIFYKQFSHNFIPKLSVEEFRKKICMCFKKDVQPCFECNLINEILLKEGK